MIGPEEATDAKSTSDSIEGHEPLNLAHVFDVLQGDVNL